MHCLNKYSCCLPLPTGRKLKLLKEFGPGWLKTDGWLREGHSALNGPLLWFSRLRSNKRKGSFLGQSSGSIQFSDLLWTFPYFPILVKKKKNLVISYRQSWRWESGHFFSLLLSQVILSPFFLNTSSSSQVSYHIPNNLSPNCLLASRPFLILWWFYISLFLPFLSSPLSFTYICTHTMVISLSI